MSFPPIGRRSLTRGNLVCLVVLSLTIVAIFLPRTTTSQLKRAHQIPSAPTTVTQISLATKDLVYDPVRQRIYASVPSSAGAIGNSITEINPVAATLGASVPILPTSSAIDAGKSLLTTDQRGMPRPVDSVSMPNPAGGNASDIGAFEIQTFQVNSIADTTDGACTAVGSGNGCTLREAITLINGQGGAAEITFSPALTAGGPASIILLAALPEFASSLSVAGPGAALLTVERSHQSGTPDFRIFKINSGKTVTISGLTVANGKVPDAEVGGDIFNDHGILKINSCVIKDAVSSGGVYNLSGSLVVNDSVVTGNSRGIINAIPQSSVMASPATVTINNSTISGNNGTGVYNNVTIGNDASPATITINNSTISGNTNASGTGAIYNAAVFNSASNSTTAAITLKNSTIFGNTAGNAAGTSGGVSIVISSCPGCIASVKLDNTILAGNLSNAGASASDFSGTADPSSSFNLIGIGGSGGLANGVNNNQVGVANVGLAPLANNGGPTFTHALLPGSPALDAGNNAILPADSLDLDGDGNTSESIPFDQRGAGFDRIRDAADANLTQTVDIGSFEAQVSIEDLSPQTLNEDSSVSLPFIVADAASITSVTATSSNTSLVPNNPANIFVSGSGSPRTLQVNPAANAFGAATITLTVNGNNSQMADTFLLTVNPINDAPSFTKGSDQTVNENDAAQTVNNWASNISAGPNEAGQSLTFAVVSNSNAGLFAVAPMISPTGTLTYTPAAGVSGTALITITLMDNGGMASGGVDTSPSQNFNITVTEGGALQFSSATFAKAEDGGSAVITITRNGGSGGIATVQFATSDGTATTADYTSVSQTITFNDRELSKSVNVPITDDLFKESNETVNLTLSNASGAGQLGTLTTAVLTILDNDPVGGYVRLASANFNTTESSGSATITVERLGDTTRAVTVDYATAEDSTIVPCATANSIASSRCDFTTAVGTLQFAAGVSSQTFPILISQDNFVEGPESLTMTLSNATGGATLSTPSAAILTIADDATEPAANPIDSADVFVRQHYHDFLNREPDAPGLAFWSNQITECQQPGATCSVEIRRINVSAAFFLSIEFQETGYLVERIYKSAYGDAIGTSNFGPPHQLLVPNVRFNEFLPDTQQIGRGVMVGVGDWQTQIENNKVAFTQNFVLRTRFITAYPTGLTPAEFVDGLFTHAGVTPSAEERASVISEFAGAGTSMDTAARARALRRVAENSTLKLQEINKAFVLMQYFGYMRRNPNDLPDTDYTGYDFWLSKLSEFNGNFVNAEMVKAFIVSGEYRQRFGP